MPQLAVASINLVRLEQQQQKRRNELTACDHCKCTPNKWHATSMEKRKRTKAGNQNCACVTCQISNTDPDGSRGQRQMEQDSQRFPPEEFSRGEAPHGFGLVALNATSSHPKTRVSQPAFNGAPLDLWGNLFRGKPQTAHKTRVKLSNSDVLHSSARLWWWWNARTPPLLTQHDDWLGDW